MNQGNNKPDEFKPKTPIMGGIEKTGTDTWSVWTGGEPNCSWTALENTSPKHKAPTQHRPTSVTSQAKSRSHRVQGLEQKFGRNSNFQQFQR